MHKKLFSIGIVAVLAVVASFAIVGTASAAEFGNCLETGNEGAGSTCGTKHTFKAFGPAAYEAVVTKKPGATAESELETPAFASGIKCAGLSGQGVVINTGNGISQQVLAFEKCKGFGPVLAPCQKIVEGKAQKLNGTEKVVGSVKAEAISATEQEITPTGFNIACSEGGTQTGGEITKQYGTVTGSIICTTDPPTKNYRLHCNHAAGLIFAGQASTQTGYSEQLEAFYPSGKVYQK